MNLHSFLLILKRGLTNQDVKIKNKKFGLCGNSKLKGSVLMRFKYTMLKARKLLTRLLIGNYQRKILWRFL